MNSIIQTLLHESKIRDVLLFTTDEAPIIQKWKALFYDMKNTTIPVDASFHELINSVTYESEDYSTYYDNIIRQLSHISDAIVPLLVDLREIYPIDENKSLIFNEITVKYS